MKKILTFLLLGGCILSLQGCISFGDSETNNTNRVERITEGEEERNEDDLIKAYYPTLAEAIKHNTFLDGDSADFTLVKTIKVVEDQRSCVLYGTIIQPAGKEIFAVMRFRIQDKDGEKNYSNLLAYTPLPPEFINDHLAKKSSITEEQKMSLNLYNDPYAIKRVDSYPNFIWSVTAKKDVKKIKVNGQKPTEIIPFKIGKDQLYFYYFDDLKNNDEFTITT